jgi:alpha-galactosidase
MSAATRTILLNKEVVAVDQDALGQQGRRVRDEGDLEVWSRPLADGSRAVLLLNRGSAPATISVAWPEIGYTGGTKATVRDLWAHKTLGKRQGSFAAPVPSHGAVMVTIKP